jgi:competence protein ComEC
MWASETNATTDAGAGAPVSLRARRRAWGALAAALLGVWLTAGLGGASWVWLAVAGGLGLLAGAVPGRWWWAPAFAAVVCLAAGWGAARFGEPASDRLDRMVADGAIVSVSGVVQGSPQARARPTGAAAPGAWRGDSAWFPLGVRSVEGSGGAVPASGVLRVFGGAELLGAVRPGDRVRMSGVFGSPDGPTNPGEPNWTRRGNERGGAGVMSVGDGAMVTVEGRVGGPAAAWARLVQTRETLRSRAMFGLGLNEADESGAAGVLGALVLGERDASFEGVYRVFQRAGVAHVLAVSGFHLVMLCGLAAAAVRITGERGRLETLVVVLVVVTLLVFVPARSPIVRAGVLALALLLGDALGRRWDRLAVLAWAGVGLLAFKPSEAMSLGYLLSVGVTGLLIAMSEQQRKRRWWLVERAKDRSGGRASGVLGWAGVGGRWVWAALRLNAACWAASAPVIIASTGVFSLLAPVATVVIVPLAGLVLVLGWAQAILGVLLGEGAAATRGPAELAAGWAGTVAGWFDAAPGSSVVVAGVGWAWAALATGAVLGLVFWRSRRAVFVGLVAVAAAYAGSVSLVAGRVEGIRVDMFDVGDGTAVLIRSGGDAVLWDCGSLQREVGGRVADAVRALGVARVRTAIITHPNLDHFNGLPVAAERLGIRRVLVPPEMFDTDPDATGPWPEVRAELGRLGVEIGLITAGDGWAFGGGGGRAGGRVEVVWPPRERSARLMGNDGSVVVRFVMPVAWGDGAREAVVLMTGDIQRAGIAGLEASGADLRADVIEVPHHGSAEAAAMALVMASGASVSLQSTGPSRLHDERWAAVRAGTRWLSTAERGAVFVRIDPRTGVEWGPGADTE